MAEKQGNRPGRPRVLSRTPKVDSEEEKAALCARFKEAVQRIGGPATFRRDYRKVASSTLHTWLNGTTAPDIGALIYLSNQRGFSPDWLLHGKGAMMTADAIAERDRSMAVSGDALRVPVFEEAFLAAGDGALIEPTPTRYAVIDDVTLRRDLGVPGRDLAIIPVQGDSMEPTIRSGELVLLDRSEQGRALSSGIYAFRLDGAQMVKRIEPVGGRMIEIRSDNHEKVPPRTIKIDDGVDFAIIGRVAVVFRRV